MTQQKTGQEAGEQELPQDPYAEPFAEPLGEPPGEETADTGEKPYSLEEVVARAVELRRENRDLKARMEQNTAELNRLDPVIAEQFAKRQIKSQKRTTGETIYLERNLYASLVRDDDGEHAGAHAAMREHGLEWLVKDKVDSGSLSAWVREQERQETEIPQGLLPFLKISEVYKVKVRL